MGKLHCKSETNQEQKIVGLHNICLSAFLNMNMLSKTDAIVLKCIK